MSEIAIEELKMYIDRIEKLDSDKASIAEQISEVYVDAKNRGYDTKVLRQVIRLRKMDEDEREEQEMLLDTYKRALGMSVSSEYGELYDPEK